MNRRNALHTLAGGAAAALTHAQTNAAGPRWKVEYFYDKDQESLHLNDLQFVSPAQGIAIGWLTDKKGRLKPMSLLTTDAGKTWQQRPLPEPGVSMFFLNATKGWLVGDHNIFVTNDGGLEWKKTARPKGNAALNRIHFHDEMNGWVVGTRKSAFETHDGGASWKDLSAAAEPDASADYTSYNWIAFSNRMDGMIVGSSNPPRAGENRPVWMDPEGASKRREWPTLTISLETRDGGKTWKSQTAPAFGQASRFRTGPDGSSIALVRFVNSFEWPSEVYSIKAGASQRIYRESQRAVTDFGWLGSQVVLVAVEPPGKLHTLPIPGKLHVLVSDDLSKWTEMRVDYRAFGASAVLAIASPNDAWIATDTGQILRLVR